MIKKLNPKIKLDLPIFLKVLANKEYRTKVMINSGPTVTNRSTTLNIMAPFPSKSLFVKSRVYIGSEPAACSKAAQKNTVNRQNMANAIIRSLSIFTYLGILMINNKMKAMAANKAKNNESGIPKIEKFNVLISPILLNGSLMIKIRAEIENTATKT